VLRNHTQNPQARANRRRKVVTSPGFDIWQRLRPESKGISLQNARRGPGFGGPRRTFVASARLRGLPPPNYAIPQNSHRDHAGVQAGSAWLSIRAIDLSYLKLGVRMQKACAIFSGRRSGAQRGALGQTSARGFLAAPLASTLRHDAWGFASGKRPASAASSSVLKI
jgi:hypothetical protein